MSIRAPARRALRLAPSSSQLLAASPRHSFSTTSILSATKVRSIVYEKAGDPGSILRGLTWEMKDPEPGMAVVRMGLGSVNPADINVLQGVYPYKPSLRDLPGSSTPLFIGGNEGFGVIEKLSGGQEAAGLKEGDKVVFGRPQMGTWSSHMMAPAKDLIKIPEKHADKLEDVMASTLMINPATALRMLSDFAQLKEGDVVVQNAANSAVGQAVVQMCASRLGFETINLVRSRPDLSALEAQFQRWGKGGRGTHVFTYEDLADKKSGAKEKIKALLDGRKIKLGLNAVCGADNANMAKLMGPSSTLVTYGAMSKQPLSVPAGLVIFSDLRLRGYQQAAWYLSHSREEREKMMDTLAQWYVEGAITPPAHQIVQLDEGGASDEELGKRAGDVVAKALGGFGKKTFFRFGGQ